MWGLAGILVLPLVMVSLVATLAAGVITNTAAGTPSTVPSPEAASIPDHYLGEYVTAAKEYGLDWPILAAVGFIESRHGTMEGRGGCIEGRPTPYGRAYGPMQFLSSTWATAGVDGNGDGKKDVCDYQDAIPAAARYLKDGGAPDDYLAAIWAYNHADWYVHQVLAIAYSYGYRGATVLSSDCPSMRPFRDAHAYRLVPPAVLAIQSAVFRNQAVPPILQNFGPSSLLGEPAAFGYEHFHLGIDWDAPLGTPIYAPVAGLAMFDMSGTYGSGVYGPNRALMLTLPNGNSFRFYHLSRIALGQFGPVNAGQLIGWSGRSGYVVGDGHLHIEMRDRNNVVIPPEHWYCSLGPDGGDAAKRSGGGS